MPTVRRALVALALCLVLLPVLPGCPPKQEAGQPPDVAVTKAGQPPLTEEPATEVSAVEIAVISNAVSPFWTAVQAGVDKAGEDLGCEATLAKCKGGLPEQRRLLENAEARGVAGIAVSPLQTEALTPVIDAIVDGGTPVLCIDSDCPGSKRYCYVGSDNYAAGTLLADEARKLLPEGATCVLFVGDAGVENSKARINGLSEGVAAKGIEVLDVMQDQGDPGKARSNVENTIQKYPDIGALVGIWSYNLPAIAAAVGEAGLHDQIKVIGFDAEPATLVDIESGNTDATVVQNPHGFGYKSVEILFALASGDEARLKELVPANEIVDTGVELVNQGNFELFKSKLQQLGIESS